DHDEVEEVRRVIPEVGCALRPRHEGLEDGEEDAAVGGHLTLLADAGRFNAHEGIVLEGGEGVEGLVGEDIAIGEEEDARPALPIAPQVPAGMEELPSDLEGDGGFAGAGGKGEQDAVLSAGDAVQRALDGDVLVVARLPCAALVLEGNRSEAVGPTGLTTGIAKLQLGPSVKTGPERGCIQWAGLEPGE